MKIVGAVDSSAQDQASLTYLFDCASGTYTAGSTPQRSCRSGTPAAARTFKARVRDKDAALSPVYSRTVLVDGAKPRGRLKINGGAASASTRRVTLRLTARDRTPASGVSKMRFSNNGRKWSSWQRYKRSRAWTLSPGEGDRTVFVQFRDRAGWVSTKITDTIRRI
jgi:hypothetical protein